MIDYQITAALCVLSFVAGYAVHRLLFQRWRADLARRAKSFHPGDAEDWLDAEGLAELEENMRRRDRGGAKGA